MEVPAGAVPETTAVLPSSTAPVTAGTVVGAITWTCTGRDITVLWPPAVAAVRVKVRLPAAPRPCSSAALITSVQS